MPTNQYNMTPPYGCVLVLDSPGEPARQSVSASACEQSASGSEFLFGGAAPGEDIPGGFPRELRWRLWLRVSIDLSGIFWQCFQSLFAIGFCVIGNEEETGGDVQEKCPLACRERTWCAGDKLLLPDDWYHLLGRRSIVFLLLTRVRIEVANYWRRRSMSVYFVSDEYCSSMASRVLHVAYSNFPILDQYHSYPSSTVFQAIGHQLVSLYNSVVQEEENRLLGPLMTSWYLRNSPVILGFIMWFLLSQLDEVFDKLSQGPSTSRPLIVDTTDTSREDTDTSQPRRRVRSKRNFKMKKS